MGSRRPQKSKCATWRVLSLLRAVVCLGLVQPSCAEPREARAGSGEQGRAPDLVGTLAVRKLEDRAKGWSEDQYLLHDGRRRWVLNFDRDPGLRTGAAVDVWGSVVDDTTFRVTSFVSEAPVAKRLDAPLSRGASERRLAVLVMAEVTAVDEQRVRDVVAEVGAFFDETTRGVDTFSLGFQGRYAVDYPASECRYEHTDSLAERVIDAFEADGHLAAQYEHIAIVAPDDCGAWEGAWGYVGGIADGGEERFYQVSMLKEGVFEAWYLAHELGHNLGMTHAASADCGTRGYRPGLRGCALSEYGNHEDVMGWGEATYFSAAHQRFMGWLGAARVVTVGGPGTFVLQPVDGRQDCGIQALRIPLAGEPGVYLYLEYRQARADSRWAGVGSEGNKQDAVLVVRATDAGRDTSRTELLQLAGPGLSGISSGVHYTVGAEQGLRVQSLDEGVAVVSVQMRELGSHRDDSGEQVRALADGERAQDPCSVGQVENP